MSPRVVQKDILIIGAGLIGSSVAKALSEQGNASVAVVDLDLAGEWSSSELNAGGVRATFSQEVNLLTSKASIEYFSRVANEVGYRACGYLWLHRKDSWLNACKARAMHESYGWPVDELDVKEIRNHYPFIDKTDDLVGALFGRKDGLVNPNRLKEHYRERAMANGVEFLDRIWIYASEVGAIKEQVQGFQFKEQLTREEKKTLLTENPLHLDQNQGERLNFSAKMIVNCAGAWAPQVATVLGYSCPSVPVRRQISLFHAQDLDLTPFGMIVDPSGVYFHPESIYGLSGFANSDEPAGFNFQYDGAAFFEKYLWPNLYERASGFERLKHQSGWAGLYESSPDHHAIVGKVEQSAVKNQIFEAHSFSGHGAMHSYAVGVALAELMLTGKYQSLDLAPLSGDRFQKGQTIPHESWVI